MMAQQKGGMSMKAEKTEKKERKPRSRILRPAGCISPNEAAKKLNITGEAIKQWIYKGRLPAAKGPNGYWYVRESDIKQFIDDAQKGKNLVFKLHTVKVGKAAKVKA
jgi:hypothetical protein